MGVYYDHDVTVHFTNESDCERFYNHIQRYMVKNHFTCKYSDYQFKLTSDDYKWAMSEMFDENEDDSDTFLESSYDENTVSLSSCGYGSVPGNLIAFALDKYNADQLYLTGSGCQGQENSKIKAYYNHKTKQFQWVQEPDWVSSF